jgi:hypothetical protein
MVIIKTNNVPRPIIYGYELSNKERAYFGYMDADDLDDSPFFRYKGEVYSLNDFIRLNSDGELKGWYGYGAYSLFGRMLIKLSNCGDYVTVGTYYS